MGTKVEYKSYLPGYYSMRDLNEDSTSGSWPPHYGDNTATNGLYYSGFLPRAIANANANLGYDKEVMKKTMLEHEATFKSQVSELHRLYRKQRDLMDEIKRKQLYRHQIPCEKSLSSSPLVSQMPYEDARKWHIPNLPLENSSSRPSVSAAENNRSSLRFTKGKGSQASPVPSPNGGSSNDCEVLDSRPTKVRRKQFDLQLPADEYIDTEEVEQSGDRKLSDMSSYSLNGCYGIAPESGVKMFPAGGGTTSFQIDALRSNSCLRSRNGLADLNEPIQVEEGNTSASVDYFNRPACHGESRDPELSAKPKFQFLGLHKERLQNSYHGGTDGSLNNQQLENKGNGREWISYMREMGHGKTNLNSTSHGLQHEKLTVPSEPLQVMLNKARESPSVLPTDQSKGELWRERTVCGLKISERNHDLPIYNHLETAVAPHRNPYPFHPSSDLAKSWSQSVSSWEKHSSSLSQRSISFQTQPCFNNCATLSKSSQSSSQSHEIAGDKWQINSNSGLNPGFGCDTAPRNGFYQGSSSGSKELPLCLPSIGLEVMKSKYDDNAAYGNFVNDNATNYFKGPNYMNVKSANNMHLNAVLLKSLSKKVVPQHDLGVIDGGRKHGEHFANMNLNAVLFNSSSNKAVPQHSLEVLDGERKHGEHFANMNLNAVLFNSSSNKAVSQHGLEVIDGERKHEDHLAVLPWLRSRPAHKNEVTNAGRYPDFVDLTSSQASSDQFPNCESGKGPSQNFAQIIASASRVHDVDSKEIEKGDCSSTKKILGFPIFVKPHSSKDESSVNSTTSSLHPSKVGDIENNGKPRMLDMNLPCDPAVPDLGEQIAAEVVAVDKRLSTKVSGFRDHIDLNSCISEDEASLTPSVPSSDVKIAMEIDLEAPAVSESQDEIPDSKEDTLQGAEFPTKQNETPVPSPQHKDVLPQDELVKIAAEAIVAISSSGPCNQSEDITCDLSEASLTDPLHWFVEVVSSCADDIERTFCAALKGKDCEDNEDGIDYFESMTLQLAESKEEEYLTRPEVSENLEVETASLANRSRRGQGKRGRQRRDFQRDILPGLASLSRHEVTEDLQTFGGLMRATGYSWQSGFARRAATRNGVGRGRQRSLVASPVSTPLMQQLNNFEVGLEDRSLTGWGKTTRRPRRQRCPAGNPPSFLLT